MLQSIPGTFQFRSDAGFGKTTHGTRPGRGRELCRENPVDTGIPGVAGLPAGAVLLRALSCPYQGCAFPKSRCRSVQSRLHPSSYHFFLAASFLVISGNNINR